MDQIKIIQKYYAQNSPAYQILLTHSQLVTEKALQIADRLSALKPDRQFIEEAAMLHDIGIIRTYAPDLDCFGTFPYLAHGYLGSKILAEEGFPRHALVCERHTGTGITKAEIISKNLPLPQRDMIPVSLEEEIICFADKFFSKNPLHRHRPKTISEIRQNLAKFGPDKVAKFNQWLKKFDT